MTIYYISLNGIKDISLYFLQTIVWLINNLNFQQACLGVIETLKSPKISSLEMAECSQKLLLQSVAAEGNTDEALKQVMFLIN